MGDADEIVQYLCTRLGKAWILPPALVEPKQKAVPKDKPAVAATILTTQVAQGVNSQTSSEITVASTSTATTSVITAETANLPTAKQSSRERSTNIASGSAAAPPNSAPLLVEPERLGARYVSRPSVLAADRRLTNSQWPYQSCLAVSRRRTWRAFTRIIIRVHAQHVECLTEQ